MNQIVKAKIDGVPVEIEIIRMGPATYPEIRNLENNLAKEDSSFVIAPPQQIKVTKIGDENSPATPADIEKVKAAISSGNKDLITLIDNLATSVSEVPTGKNWWESKTVWINAIAILTPLLAYFGLDFKLDPEFFTIVFPVVIALINLWLRKGTDAPLSKNVIPTFKSFKSFR